MSVPIEAQSISSLTHLLSNPPQYPRNPTHDPHDPLVLYIIRVPGSKDVFLSPLRPPTKASISLEAIQTSLYYLHVETPEDEILRESIDVERRSENLKSATQSILRKPLPPTPHSNYPAWQRPATPPKSYPNFQPPGLGVDQSNQSGRYAVRGSHIRLGSKDAIPAARKLLGARPMDTGLGLSQCDSASVDDSELYPIDHKGWSAPDRKPVPWTPRLEIPEQVLELHDGLEGTNAGRTGAFSESADTSDGMNITLIRRDPTSGTQWNVGRIIQSRKAKDSSILRPIEVVLDTPGYGRFAHTPYSNSSLSNHSNVATGRRDVLSSEVLPPNSRSRDQALHGFTRTVCLRPVAEDQKSPRQRLRSNSNDILSSVTNSSVRKARQIYSFISPWQGICSFSNGVDGRSLKCRHSLPSNSHSQEASVAAVAELRFNLPWSVLGVRDANRRTSPMDSKIPITHLVGVSKKQQWRRSVQTLANKSWNPKSGDHGHDGSWPALLSQTDDSANATSEEDGRLSLRLGREKAGGGFKGDSAKLGKLIIEDEGLKMCDLVVGACMGIWWQHYMDGAES